jgi:hypothetical protein
MLWFFLGLPPCRYYSLNTLSRAVLGVRAILDVRAVLGVYFPRVSLIFCR